MDFAASIDRLIGKSLASAQAQLGADRDQTAPPPAAPVDIAVPIHNAWDDAERCIAALRAYTDERHRIVLIDDASSDPRVAALLQRVASSDPRVVVRGNPENLGYLRTVNVALAASDRDVVLLNSDALVGPQWLDRLAAGAYSDARVAFACPVSDNATLLTVMDPAHAASQDPEALARLTVQSAAGGYPRLPVAVGFCLYVRRDAIRDLGDFDPAFDPGYGEENDLSMRAWLRGWSIVVCPDVLVRHVGGSSFGQRPQTLRMRELHARILSGRWPQHDALLRRWWSDWPLREQALRMRQRPSSGKPRVLHVLHRMHRLGGTELHSQQMAAALSDRFDCTLVAPDSALGHWADFAELPAEDGVERLLLNETDIRPNQRMRGVAADLSDPGVERRFAKLVNAGHYDLVHFHSLLHWNTLMLPQLAAAAGAAVVVTLHSLESLCADYTLVPPQLGQSCGKAFGGADEDCVACLESRFLRRAGAPVTPVRTYLDARHRMWQRALEAADCLVAPSAFVAARVSAAFGDAVRERMAIVPHGIAPLARVAAPGLKQRFTVGFLGGLSQVKGAGIVLDLARCPDLSHVRFELYGCADPDELPAGLPPNVMAHSSFAPAHLATLLARVHVVLLPSLAEETFSLLLSECRAAGVPVIASRVGALSERIRHGIDGWLLPPLEVDAWRQQIKVLARPFGRIALARVRKVLSAEQPRSIADNAADYAALYEQAIAAARSRRRPKASVAAGRRDVASATLERLGGELRHARWDDGDAEHPSLPEDRLPPLTVVVRIRGTELAPLTRTLQALRKWPGTCRFELIVDDAAHSTIPASADCSVTRIGDDGQTAALRRRMTAEAGTWRVNLDAGDTLSARAADWLAMLHDEPCDAFHGALDHVSREGHCYAPAVQGEANMFLSLGAAQATQGLFVRGNAVIEALGEIESDAWPYALLLASLRTGTAVRDVGHVLVHRFDQNVSAAQRDGPLAANCAVAERHRIAIGVGGECVLNDARFGWRWRPAPRSRRVAIRIHGALSEASAGLALQALRRGLAPGMGDVAIFYPGENLSRVDRIVLVRADVRPQSVQWVEHLLGWLEVSEVVAVAPRRTGPFGALQPCGWQFDGSWLRRIDDPRSTTGFDVGNASDHARQLPALSTTCIALALDRIGDFDLASLLEVDPLQAFAAQQRLRVHGMLVWTPDATVTQQHADRPIARDPTEPMTAETSQCLHSLRTAAVAGPHQSWRRRPLRGAVSDSANVPRIAALTRDYWASSQLRVAQPLADLLGAGAIAAPALWRARLEAVPRLAELADHRPDTLLLHQCFDDDSLDLLELCAEYLPQVRRVVLVDDLVTAVPSYNPTSLSIPADIDTRLRRAIGSAHLLVTTSDALAEHYANDTTPVRVIENALGDRWFDLPRATRAGGDGRPLRVGWAGAQQHAGDLELIDGLIAARRDVHWVFMGMAPASANAMGAEMHPMVDFDDYPERLASLALDIALVPLADNEFNRCKSALKLMEFGALGIPVIASNLRPYGSAPVLHVPAELAAWHAALAALCESRELRERSGDALHAWSASRHRQPHRRADWSQALTDPLAGAQ